MSGAHCFVVSTGTVEVRIPGHYPRAYVEGREGDGQRAEVRPKHVEISGELVNAFLVFGISLIGNRSSVSRQPNETDGETKRSGQWTIICCRWEAAPACRNLFTEVEARGVRTRSWSCTDWLSFYAVLWPICFFIPPTNTTLLFCTGG